MICPGSARPLPFTIAVIAFLSVLSPAPAAAQSFTLTVHMGGNTSGTVSVVPTAGLCSSPALECTFTVPAGSSVRLSANGGVPGRFSSGTGPASACELTTCGFTMSAAAEITATFTTGDGPTATVTTSLAGDGTGEVGVDNSRCQNFDPAQFSGCTTTYLVGSVVSISGRAAAGSRFTRFMNGTGGAVVCGSSSQCSFTLNANAALTATFSALEQLVVTPASVTGPVGQAQIFTARGAHSDGVTESLVPGVGTWITKAAMSTFRFSLSATVLDGKLYAIGGIESGAPSPLVAAYDPTSNTWTNRAPMPTPREALGAVTVGGQIYAVGGNTTGSVPVATVEQYDPSANGWTARASLSAPRRFLAAGAVNGIIYAVGGETVSGVTPTGVGTVEAYDPATNVWTARSPMPTARRGLAVAVVDGILYAIGGNIPGGPPLATVEAYNPATNAWTAKAPLPSGLTQLAAAVTDGVIYVVGGADGGAQSSVSQYDIARDAWSLKSGLPTSRSSLAAAAIGGIVYAAGGQSTPGQFYNKLEAFTETLRWSSSAPSAVPVTQQGFATAVGVATATIAASAGTITSGANSATFTVTPLPSDMFLDTPANNSTVLSPFTVSGWAINRSASSGTGVDAVHVYAFPAGGGSPIFLGPAAYGSARPDIGAIFGAQFTNCGFTFSAATLAQGTYTLVAYAHNALTATFDKAQSATITVVQSDPNGLMNIDSPTPGAIVTSAFEVGGWAIDRGAASGTGVDAVQFYVFPNDGASPGVFIGNGSYGAARPDVGAVYGSRFTNSGYHFTITGLGPGNFLLGVYARSTVTGQFSIVKALHFTVNANALMSIDTPTAESTITTPNFNVAGWAIDRAIESTATPGTGVDALHIYAYPNPGSGQAPIFLGVATLGFARSDVAALYGSRYTNSGYNLSVNAAAAGLTPGVYSIVVHAHSAASGAFNNSAVMRVTIQ